MRRMARYEAGQLATTVASLIFVGVMMFDIVGGRSFGAWSVLAYLFYPLIGFLFALAVWRNWRGIVDEQVAREQDRTRKANYRFLPPPEKRSTTLQRINKWMTLMWGRVVSFYLVGVVLYLTGYLR